MRLTHGLRAITLATVVALTGVTALVAPAAAIDPIPSATPDPSATASPAPTPDPSATPDPAPAATPDPSAAPTATSDPAPTATPDPLATPDPAATPSPDPSSSPTPTPDPSATPTPTTTTVATPAAKPNLGRRIVRIALAQRHKRYVYGAAGPSAFDCSGLVRFAYRRAHLSRFLGGGHSAWAMYHWGLRHHLTSRSHPHVGDVVIYGRGTHVGIYIGHGLVVSALNPRLGIRVTRLHALTSSFTTFIHTRLR